VSIPVSLLELPEVMARFGPNPDLLSVSEEATPRATSVSVHWSGDQIVAGAGRRTAANLRANDQVALLWAPPTPDDYTLIVDGWGTVQPGPAGGFVVTIQPKSAILHVTQRT
jgi:hypothetical protein